MRLHLILKTFEINPQFIPPVVKVVGYLLDYWITNPETARVRYNEFKLASSFIELELLKKMFRELWGDESYINFMLIVDPSGIDE